MKPRLSLVDVASEGPSIVGALRGQLRSLRELIELLPEHTFRATPSESSGSVGGHVRHCLDHVRALTTALNDDEISYDSRLRGTAIETSPIAAIEEINRLLDALDDVDDAALARDLLLHTLVSRGLPPVRVRTTVEREATFVVQHTIHHCATMAVLLERMRISVPHDFGYAPSTPRPGLQLHARG
jgi:uncharacterized damage-inducible protein DinB